MKLVENAVREGRLPKCTWRLVGVLAALVSVLPVSAPLRALQITFPLEAPNGEVIQKPVTLKSRTLKEYFDKFQVTYKSDVYRYGTYGDRSRAFRPDKTYYQELLGITAGKKLRNDIHYEVKGTLRYVTDPIVTLRDDVHFTSLVGLVEKEDFWRMRFGDLYPRLSRYSFNRFAEGWQGSLQRDLGSFAKVRLLGVTARTEREREAASLLRTALAGGADLASQTLVRGRPRWFVGYRYSHAADKLNSVDNHGSLVNAHSSVSSAVYAFRLNGGWTITGENAWSGGERDRKTAWVHKRGKAWLTDVTWLKPRESKPYRGLHRLLPFALQASWERVSPDFLTLLGVAATDQQKYSIRTAHRWNSFLEWSLSYLRLEDNVEEQKSVTNISRTTTAGLKMRPFRLLNDKYSTWISRLPDSVKDIRLKADFRYNFRDATDATVNQKVEDYIYSLFYRNWGANFRLDYQFQITDDDVNANNERRLQNYGILVNRPWTWKRFNLRLFPRFMYRVSRDHFRFTGTSTVLQTTNFGIGANWEELTGDVNYLILDSNRTPAGNDYLQNKITFNLTYRPYLFPGFQSTFTYSYLDDNEEDASRSYRQTETRLSIRYTF